MKRLLYQAFIVSSVSVLAGISVILTLAGASDSIPNGALVAVSDFLEISQFESVDFDPLSNDEVVNAPAVLIDYSDPSHGSILVNNDGSLRYYPNKIFIGDDSLSYTIEDAEGNQAVGLVTITITPDEVFKVYPSDRLARLIVDSPFIYSGNASQVLQTWTQTVYKKAKDEFDFIIFIQNCNSCISDFSGIFIVTSNQVEGIGLSVFNDNIGWGAGTKLQGVLYLTNIRNLRSGPSLHELLHNWANYVIPPNVSNIGSHWGVAGTPGQLGGFDPESLINHGGNQYQATNGRPGSTSFGVNANGGNSLPYSALELYLMGLVPAFEVPPVPVAVNPQAVDFANGIFSADSFVETTIDDLITSYGPRVPAYGASPEPVSYFDDLGLQI